MATTSTSSARRLKERGPTTGSNSIVPSKPIKSPTPLSQKPGTFTTTTTKSTIGSSCKFTAVKPAIRPIPGIEKPTNRKEMTQIRRSTSSVPRGRSSSPFDVPRVLADLKKDNIDQRRGRVSLDGQGRSVSGGRKVNGCSDSIAPKKMVRASSAKRDARSDSEVRVLRNFGPSVNNLVSLVKKKEHASELKPALNLVDSRKVYASNRGTYKSNVDSNLNVSKFSDDSDKVKVKSCLSKMSDSSIEKTLNGLSIGLNKAVKTSSISLKVSDTRMEKGLGKESVEITGGVKYSSKLHERLAFLEGKVNRIASDIKETKEMLATNNLDTSQVILTNIKDKIMCIEKAIECVGSDPISDLGPAKFGNNENGVSRLVDGSFGSEVANSTDLVTSQSHNGSSGASNGNHGAEISLTANESLGDIDEQENVQPVVMDEEVDEKYLNQLHEIGCKVSTAGWFVSEGESAILAHDDGSCTFYDIANCEVKAEYTSPAQVSPNIWKDCWIIRAPDADGCSGKYVIAASAGNTTESGFCSWDFYKKDVRAFHVETIYPFSRTALAPLPNNSTHQTNRQWWYKPCGLQPLMVSTASRQHVVKTFDIRDGEQVLKWEVQSPVASMDYSSPLQWRNRGKVVIAEEEAISLWDVNSINPQALLSVSLSGKKISGLHINNTDAELGGGVRQRVSSSEAEGNDGFFCTTESINILDFRNSSGIGLKIPKLDQAITQSVFSRGDSIFIGSTSVKGKKECTQVQQFSLRKQRLLYTYTLPASNASITQVWGNSDMVMAVSQSGMFVFDNMKDNEFQPSKVQDTIGPDDLRSPSFDYLSSRALLISRDRPAMWRHL